MSNRYYIFEPEWDGCTLFNCEKEWQKAVDEYDFLGKFCHDGWSEEVWNVVAGVIPEGVKIPKYNYDEIEFYNKYAVYTVGESFREERPTNLPDDCFDEEGRWWGDFDYLCGYAFFKKDAPDQNTKDNIFKKDPNNNSVCRTKDRFA